MIDFSIIIPVYNAERTLEKCLNSIKTQTFLNYEVILIDDGSYDSSLSICKQFEKRDQRYRIFHQSNSGPSVARNVGLNEASGEWICFIDSDDTIERDYLQEIFNAIQQYEADVVFLGHYKIHENGNRDSFIPSDVENTKMRTFVALSNKDMFGYTWVKCFRKDTIKNIRFDSTLNLFEDEVFTCQVLSNCARVGVVRKPIYNYYIGNGSTLMGRTHEDYCLKCDKVYEAWDKLLLPEPSKRNLMENKANSFVTRSFYYAFERNVDIKKYFSYLKETKYFQEHTEIRNLDEYVKSGNYRKLCLEKMKYQVKLRIFAWLKRRR